MNDTPRTDAARISAWGEGGIENSIGFSAIPVEFARQLERELAEAKEQLRLCNVDQFTTAAELAEAVAKERERCAWICDALYSVDNVAQKCAAAIRKGK